MPDGRQFVGEWKDGKLNGQGTYTHLNGRKYIGEWRDGQPNRQGTMTKLDGSVIHSGKWVNGKPIK